MRNKKLDSILHSMSWDRGHSAGQEEVDQIYKELCEEFKEIDAMLPRTMDPQFTEGDIVDAKDGHTRGLRIIKLISYTEQDGPLYSLFHIEDQCQYFMYQDDLVKSNIIKTL